MSYSFSRYSGLLLALILAGGLAACSSTSTNSGASRATTTTDESTPGQQQVDAAPESTDADDATDAADAGLERAVVPAEMEVLADPTESMEQTEATPDGVTTGATQQSEPVEGVAVFPEQRYEIEDTSGSEADPEIERLRSELAATESELDRMRDEESQLDYSTGQADASESGAESDRTSSGDDQADYSDRADTSRSSADAMQDTAPDSSRSGGDDVDLYGKPAEFSIYFGYDQTGFDSRFEPVIVAHAEFLKVNPGLKAEVQGNCDERGSREYNIALGQRRAEAIKRALELLGVDGNRIATVSFGSEKPVAFGRDEESWRLNRRADIVY